MELDEKKLSEIFDNKRRELGYKKKFLANELGIHTNTIKFKIRNPSMFTLDELLTLKDLFKADNIDQIFFDKNSYIK